MWSAILKPRTAALRRKLALKPRWLLPRLGRSQTVQIPLIPATHLRSKALLRDKVGMVEQRREGRDRVIIEVNYVKRKRQQKWAALSNIHRRRS
jgi:hypothetical protein